MQQSVSSSLVLSGSHTQQPTHHTLSLCKTQNIGGENAGDAFYRYKMPKLMAKVGGGEECMWPVLV